MTVTVTESAHLDAVLAVLDAGDAEPYTVQQAKRVSVLPPAYNEVRLEPRAGGSFRLTATTDRIGYRIVVNALGDTYERAQAMREAAFTALRGASLVIGGVRSTPVSFEGGQPIDNEDADHPGYYAGQMLWTYAI